MAAIVASLAAFVAGWQVPAVRLGFGSSGFSPDSSQDRDLDFSSREDSDSVWAPTALQLEARVGKATGPKGARSGIGQASIASPPGALESSIILARGPASGKPIADTLHHRNRRVRFDLGKVTHHEITPYAEVYGVHPSRFNFGRGLPAPPLGGALWDPLAPGPTGCMPKGGWPTGDGSESDSDDEDLGCSAGWRGWRAARLCRLSQVHVPWHAWFAASVLTLLLRAFGADALRGHLGWGGSELAA
mmetsp:Transcript_5663/g.15260  ORF Transcript_5663/g.15260 Transcript_5663/m.15260 type:complete len:246 (-) Transcript_5663:86-823(-)